MGKQVDFNPAYECIHPAFHSLMEPETRYTLITGGRGGMKSFNVALFANLLTYGDDQRVLFTRYTMTSAEISIIPEFQEKIELLDVEEHFDVRSRDITNNQTGSDIIFRGIKASGKVQTAKLKSIQGVTTWINDESEELADEDVFDTIDLSIRSNKRINRIILAMNPTDRDHWVYKRWIENSHKVVQVDGVDVQISTHPEVTHIHTTYLQNDHLSPSYLKRIAHLKASSPDKYKYKIIGAWRSRADGVVFTNWKEGEYDESIPYGFGMDYGFFPDPQAVVQAAIDHKRKIIYAKERLYATELSDTQIVESLDGIVVTKKDLIVTDTSENRTTTKLRQKGFNIIKAKKGPGSIIAGIRLLQDYTIIVDAESSNLKRELNTYVWNDKRASIPIDDNNHLLDSLRYICTRLAKSGATGPQRLR